MSVYPCILARERQAGFPTTIRLVVDAEKLGGVLPLDRAEIVESLR